MKVPHDYIKQILELSDPIPCDGDIDSLSDENKNKLLIESIVMAAIIRYHYSLKEELLKHGIDIGDFTVK